MKTLKYLLITMVIAFAIAGCTGGTGASNEMSNLDTFDRIDKAVYTENYGESN